MVCSYCKSDALFLKAAEEKTGLYCRHCGRWIKWVDAAEKDKIQKEIEKKKREVKIDGVDLERVMSNYKSYKDRFKALNEEIKYFQDRVSKNKNTSEIESKAFYDKVLKLKELTNKIAAYDEILMILNLR